MEVKRTEIVESLTEALFNIDQAMGHLYIILADIEASSPESGELVAKVITGEMRKLELIAKRLYKLRGRL